MNNFREYLEIKECVEIFEKCNLIDENWLNAAISGVGNVGSQLVRGAGNIAGGIYNTGAGAVQTGIGALQGMGGGIKKGRSNVKSGIKRTAGGLGQGIKGITQIVASPVSGAVRAAQANDEDFLTSMEPDRTPFQKTFGLNTWDAKEKQELRKQKALEAEKEELRSKEFAKYMIAYRKAKTKEEKEKAVKGMRTSHPEKFEQLRKAAEDRIARQIHKNRAELRRRARAGEGPVQMKISDAV